MRLGAIDFSCGDDLTLMINEELRLDISQEQVIAIASQQENRWAGVCVWGRTIAGISCKQKKDPEVGKIVPLLIHTVLFHTVVYKYSFYSGKVTEKQEGKLIARILKGFVSVIVPALQTEDKTLKKTHPGLTCVHNLIDFSVTYFLPTKT